jgi:hypothetical protein
MSFTFRAAKRENVSLLIGLAGSSGSGKTFSALRVASGLAGGERFAVIDTEAGRAKHYADRFAFDHGDLKPPFRPSAYADAIAAADDGGYPVIVVDSTSHEHAGEGGLLDWHEEELDRMAGSDWKKRDTMNMAAWVKPKMAHRQFIGRLLQVRAHLILCFRAEQKIDMVKDPQTGKMKIVPKKLLSGHVDWIPICEKNTLYELTLSLLLTADAPGVAKPVKLEDQLRSFVPLDEPLTEQTGASLAEWARGSSTSEPASRPAGSDVDELTIRLTRMLAGNTRAIAAIRTHREGHTAAQHESWLKRQIERVEAAAAEAGGASEANPAPDAGEGAPSDADLVEQADGAMALTVPAEVRSRMETGQ